MQRPIYKTHRWEVPLFKTSIYRDLVLFGQVHEKKCKVDPCAAMLSLEKEKLSHNTYLARYDVHRDIPWTDLDSFRN